MRFGLFLPPVHPAGQSPTWAFERDLRLIEWLDCLDYDEVWIGEHHSGGAEIIASPEVFIAVAAERTRRIKLGTGVSSLPYHHPLILADRIVLLDHLTRGRIMFGVGPGALPYDASMLGINPLDQRRQMAEGLEAILLLLAGDEPVTMETDWFTLRDARLQLRPYQRPCFEVAVAAMVSPAGPRAAGQHGLGLLSIGATSTGGFDLLGTHWAEYEASATAAGLTADRERWRLVGPMHIAETAAQARADVAFGLSDWVDYFTTVAALPFAPDTTDPAAYIDGLIECGQAVIGTPDDAVAQLERLTEKSGGFGTFLFMAHDWADEDATHRSYELFARHVIPRYKESASRALDSRDWTMKHHDELLATATAAIKAAGHARTKP
jgi:limonene 1,2-monooxygenase